MYCCDNSLNEAENRTNRQEIYYNVDEKYDSNFTSNYMFCSAILEMTMCAYVYFIPRMIAFRCVTIGEEKKKSHFWPMTYLMVAVLASSIFNVCRCFNFVSNPTILSVLIWRCLVRSFQQCINPITLLVCIQQFAEIQSFQFSHLFLEGAFQHVYVFLIFVANSSVNFISIVGIFGDEGFDDKHREQNIVVEIVMPIITFLIYNTVRARFRKERYYERASGNDDGKPNIVDRMGKIVWYDAVVAVGSSIARMIYDSDNDFSDGYLHFFLNADTPLITCVAYLSVLRKTRPTRPCFLLCCTEEDVSQPTSLTRVGISG